MGDSRDGGRLENEGNGGVGLQDRQYSADRDQTSSDADQTWADHDQDASDRDQAAAQEDQLASDDGVAAGSDRSVHARTSFVRARASADRHLVSQLRDETGRARLRSAEERDRVADERDLAATEKDLVALALLDATASVPYDALSTLIERGSEMRQRAAADRVRAAADRVRAAGDREAAARDRAAVIRQLDAARAELQGAPADVLLQALTECDIELGFHMRAVVELARATAVQLGATAEDSETTRQVALLHDVGKVAIPDEILNKPGSLDASEWVLIRQHTLIGERIIQAAPALAHIAKHVRSTHERYDGCGYPEGLAGDCIPLIARIVSVCDAYEAMITTRAYGTASTRPEAIAELRKHAGTQFDPKVVDAFVRSLDTFGDALGG
jgi:HD-GYP domain-containing protein (c-di-GMP phosphodiesterase class II)